MNKLSLIILLYGLINLGCAGNSSNIGLTGLNNFVERFDFNDSSQLSSLPTYGTDPSYIENNQLKCPILANDHKGLGRKFYFLNVADEPDEAEIEFTLWIHSDFQKNGALNEAGKFSGFEGIYDDSAGWGGRKVTDQNSWSVRICNAKEDADGQIPIGLYVYHPGMEGDYGTVVDSGVGLNKEQTYTLKLYIKLNDIDKKNGVLRLSLDGTEIYSSTSWKLRTDNSVHIKSVWLDTYIGGTTPSAYQTYVIMDDLNIRW